MESLDNSSFEVLVDFELMDISAGGYWTGLVSNVYSGAALGGLAGSVGGPSGVVAGVIGGAVVGAVIHVLDN